MLHAYKNNSHGKFNVFTKKTIINKYLYTRKYQQLISAIFRHKDVFPLRRIIMVKVN